MDFNTESMCSLGLVVSMEFLQLLSTSGRQKYGGMDAQHLKELKALEEENARLKRMFADLSLDHRILKDIIEKKL